MTLRPVAAGREEGPGNRALLVGRLLACALAGVAAASLAGCGGGTASKTATTTRRAEQPRAAARDLQALLPAAVAGVRLRKASATGAAVFGGDEFSKSMTLFLRSLHRRPSELRFANARPASGAAAIEVGVFDLPGVAGPRLLRAIVAASRPNAPGLATSSETVGGRRTTRLTYPGGAILYLHAAGSRVFYVGTQSRRLAATVLEGLP